MVCYHCGAAVHVRCLADRMLGEAGGGDETEVIPSEGFCWAPACARRLLWSRLVKGVQVYRPRSTSSSSSLEDEDYRSGGMTFGGGPLVWRVDDSSDDEGDEGGGDDSGGDSEHAARGDGGWSGGSASRDNEETEEDEESEDDGFWKLGGGYSQGRQAGGTGQTKHAPSRKGGSGQCRPSPLPAGGRAQAAKSERGEHASFVLVDTSDQNDSDSSSSVGGNLGRETQQSPSSLPLAERLRLRRLDSRHE